MNKIKKLTDLEIEELNLGEKKEVLFSNVKIGWKINELIDKQAEIIDFINAVQIIESRLNLFREG